MKKLLIVLLLVCPMSLRAEFELRTEEWTPPRLVEGVWVTSGISDEKAKEIAAKENAGQTEEQIRDGEWDAHWKIYWRSLGSPAWARERGQREAEQQRQRQQGPINYRWYAPQPETTLGEELLGAWNDFRWGWQQGTQAASQHIGFPGYRSTPLPPLDGYGAISELTGRPKTVSVKGYYRKDGTYVRPHYRSPPRR